MSGAITNTAKYNKTGIEENSIRSLIVLLILNFNKSNFMPIRVTAPIIKACNLAAYKGSICKNKKGTMSHEIIWPQYPLTAL